MTKKKKTQCRISLPKTIKGGIRAQLPRTFPKRSPWTQTWHDYVESLGIGARLGRGRSYAVSGQVMDLKVSPGLVEARVQGGGPEPYKVEIGCAFFADSGKIVSELRSRPMLLARLLARKLPSSVDLLFRASGCPLFPSKVSPLEMRCNCPDGAEICKHAAAVLLIFEEAIEYSPMLLAELRGVSAEDLFAFSPGGDAAAENGRFPAAEASFWDAGTLPPGFGYGAAESGFVAGSLGSIPFWRGEQKLADCLSRCNERIVRLGKTVASGSSPKRNFTVE